MDQNEICENELQPQKSLEIPNLVWRDAAETHSHRHTWASHKSAICSLRRSDWDGSWTPANTDQWAKKTNQTETRCVCTLAVLRESYLINDVTETGQRRKDAGANSAFVYMSTHSRDTRGDRSALCCHRVKKALLLQSFLICSHWSPSWEYLMIAAPIIVPSAS